MPTNVTNSNLWEFPLGQMGEPRHPLPGCRLPLQGARLIVAIATVAALVAWGVRRG